MFCVVMMEVRKSLYKGCSSVRKSPVLCMICLTHELRPNPASPILADQPRLLTQPNPTYHKGFYFKVILNQNLLYLDTITKNIEMPNAVNSWYAFGSAKSRQLNISRRSMSKMANGQYRGPYKL